jgi:peptidyl-prolyl cis-trans isomerase SurA
MISVKYFGVCIACLLLSGAIIIGCKTTAPAVVQAPPPAEPAILTLGNKAFSTDDFFQSFTKNQTSADSGQRTDLKEYLDLYANLKLKVVAAEAQGRDTTEGFREEIATYRKQLAQSYLTDKAMVETLSNEAWQRMQQEVSASHILLAVPEDAAPADTLAALKTATELRARLANGEDFAALAKTASKDPATAQNGGNLGYFTAFDMLYPLETAAYQTAIGQVSQPVRTRFGYHLIKVNDRRPSRGKVRVAHILVSISPVADAAGQQATQNRINEAYNRLQKGEDWNKICREFSDDVTSRSSGGALPQFQTGRNVPAFEEAAFALMMPGQYSRPVRTNYGWHILRLIEKKPIEPYTDLAPALRQKVTTDTRADVLRQATVARLRREYAVQQNQAVLNGALAKADTSLLTGHWKNPAPTDATLAAKTIVTIADKPFTVGEFFGYVKQKQTPRPAGAVPTVVMARLFDRFVGDKLLATEEANLEKKYPEFRALLGEIRDGVLLSQGMEQNVWERSMADSTGQRAYFEAHKAEYTYPERAVATVIVAQNDTLLKQARDILKTSPYQLRRSAPSLDYKPKQTALSDKNREDLFDVLVVLVKNPDYVVEISASHDGTEQDSVSASRLRDVVKYLRTNGIQLMRIIEKDMAGFREGIKDPAALRQVKFQYFSTSKKDVEKVLNANAPNSVSILEGIFAEGMNAYVDSVDMKPGTTVLHPDTKAVQVTIVRVEAPRPRTFDEARGKVINAYQVFLEKQWLASLRQQFPVKINEDEIRKLTK